MVATVRRGRRRTRPGIVVHGNVAGSIQYGDHNVQVNDNHGTVVVERVTATRNRRPIAAAPRGPDPFVARSAELQRITAAVGARRAITVSGPPGVGRTALLRAAANLPDAALPDGVLRLDGVDDAGTALTIADLAQRLHDAAWDCAPAARMSLESARTQLGAIQALAIVDDVGLPGPEIERLADLLPAGAVLIAMGAPPAVGDLDDVPVGALDRSDAVALLTAKAGLDPAQPSDAPADAPAGSDLAAMCELLADWPEALVVAGRAMVANHLSPAAAHEALAAVTPSGGLPHEVALERAWALARPGLDDHARRLLVAASVLPGRTHDPALLRRVLGEPDWFGPAAEALQALGLLTLNSPRYRVPDGIRGLISSETDAIETDEIRDRHLDVALEAAKERALDPDFVASEIGALLGAFDHAQRRGRLEDAVRLGRLISPRLVLDGLWDAWERVATAVGHAAERLGWTGDVAWSAHELGTRDLALGNRAAAQQALEEALRLREELGDEEGAAYTEHNLRRLLGGGGWWDGPLRRYLLGGGALVVGLLVIGLVGPPVAGFVQDWIRPAGQPESPAPSDAAVASPSPGPTTIETAAPSAESPVPSDVPDPLVIATALGSYEFEGRDWTTTLEITLTGGGGDYLVVLDGLGERRESRSSFVLSGRDCERYTVTGTASSASQQRAPVTVPVGPSECPSLQPVLDVACVTFDDLDVGTTYGERAGQRPGDLVYQTAEGVRVYIHDFLNSDGPSTFSSASIASDGFGSGPFVVSSSLNLEFDFNELPFEPRRVDFAFRDQGGNQNFSVNGSDVHRQLILEAPSPIGGVSWGWADPEGDGTKVGTLDGTVERFLIGGQEFSLDTVCAHR